MKNIVLASFLVLLVTACTEKSENNKPADNEQVVVLEAKSGIFTGSADFGSFNVGSTSTKLVTFTLKNNGDESLSGPPVIDNLTQGFSLTYTNCPSSLARTKSCMIKVTFDPRTLSAGAKTANLNFDSVFVSMTALMNAPVATPSVDYILNSAVVSLVDFGQITDKQSVLKSITIKNTGSSSINDTVAIPVGYTLSYDSCSGKTIAKNSSCNIKITLSGAGKSGVISGDVVYAGESLALTGEVIAAATYSNVVIQNSAGATISSYNFGTLSGSGSSQLILNIKNIGTGSASAANVMLTGTDYSIVFNQCSGVSLAPNASCQVRVLFSASGKLSNTYTSTLSYGDKQVALSATVAPAFSVSNITLSSDNKSFTITGTGLSSVVSAKLLESNQTEIDTLTIDSQTATQLILKPSKDLSIPAGDIIMRIQ